MDRKYMHPYFEKFDFELNDSRFGTFAPESEEVALYNNKALDSTIGASKAKKEVLDSFVECQVIVTTVL